MSLLSELRSTANEALSEWASFRWGVPGARTVSGDQLAEATHQLLDAFDSAVARAWVEGHDATDEHGPGECECPNPYAVSDPQCRNGE